MTRSHTVGTRELDPKFRGYSPHYVAISVADLAGSKLDRSEIENSEGNTSRSVSCHKYTSNNYLQMYLCNYFLAKEVIWDVF